MCELNITQKISVLNSATVPILRHFQNLNCLEIIIGCVLLQGFSTSIFTLLLYLCSCSCSYVSMHDKERGKQNQRQSDWKRRNDSRFIASTLLNWCTISSKKIQNMCFWHYSRGFPDIFVYNSFAICCRQNWIAVHFRIRIRVLGTYHIYQCGHTDIL